MSVRDLVLEEKKEEARKAREYLKNLDASILKEEKALSTKGAEKLLDKNVDKKTTPKDAEGMLSKELTSTPVSKGSTTASPFEGKFNPSGKTEAQIRAHQDKVGTKVDGIWGKNSKAAEKDYLENLNSKPAVNKSLVNAEEASLIDEVTGSSSNENLLTAEESALVDEVTSTGAVDDSFFSENFWGDVATGVGNALSGASRGYTPREHKETSRVDNRVAYDALQGMMGHNNKNPFK